MVNEKTKVVVYGANQICASCVNAPSSKETYEWLQAAISRKFLNANSIKYEYIDVNEPPASAEHNYFVQGILDDQFFYPLVVINEVIVGEGNPQLKRIFKTLQELGYE